MPYTKNPTFDTYSTERVQLYRETISRAGNVPAKDETAINVVYDFIKEKHMNDERRFISKRAGTTLIVAAGAASSIRGMYFWADQGKVYYCVGRDIIIYNVNTPGSVTKSNAFATSTGDVGFCEFQYAAGTTVICATDGTATTGLVKIDSANTLTTNADADLPTHLPQLVYLDGYLFVVKANTALIYNSDLDNPFSWSTDGIIQAELEGDNILKIAKINNYLIAMGSETIEYFWDAANVAPGSPMQRNDTPIKINTFLTGFASYGNTVFYIGKNLGGQPDVFMLKDFKIESVGTPTIGRYLATQTDGFSAWRGNLVAFMGHTYYVITAGAYTYALDVENVLWRKFAYQTQTGFPIDKSVSTISTTTCTPFFSFAGGSALYKFDETLYQDNGTNFPVSLVTDQADFNTMRRKTMSRASIIGDRTPVNSNLLIQWSDDDYQTFNTGVYVNLNQDIPCVYQLGSFRQRVFKLTHSDNTLFRINEMECDINKGTS